MAQSRIYVHSQAEVFIPQWLKDIQNQPQTLQPLPPSSPFPPVSYVRSFLLHGLIDQLCKPSLSNLLTSPPPPLKTAPPLGIDTYGDHWSTLLAWELDTLAKDKEQLILWKNPIKVLDWDRSEFVLEVPGLRENYPRLEIGDLAHLRMIFEDAKTGSGRAFEARVNMLRKREGLVRKLSCLCLKPNTGTHRLFLLYRCRLILPCAQISHPRIPKTHSLLKNRQRSLCLLRRRRTPSLF